MHKILSDYHRILKHIITDAKKKYHDKQFLNASGDPKKTWQIIKKTSKIISPILSLHFNYLMEVGKFPDELKLGKITPIYEKESDELLENYRPVSTLPIFGKIFEKIIYSRLYKYFVSKGILHDRQFGFMKQHSTSHALNYAIDKIKQSIDQDDHVLGIFIDLSKAFDTIDHKILINKLNHYGIRGNTLSLIESYLSNRKQLYQHWVKFLSNFLLYLECPREVALVRYSSSSI